MRRESKLMAVIIALLTAMAILSGAIAVPLLCRSFYYVQIGPLHLSLRSRLSGEEIKETYGEIMDYCLGKTDVFHLSHLPWSGEGASHFADVRGLFLLDLRVAVISILLLGLLWLIQKKDNIRPALLNGHTPGFWAAAGLGITFLTLGGFAALDFDRMFTIFHNVFFPGKDNWIFDSVTDPVIRILPQIFFQNCALLIFTIVVACCIILLWADRRYQRKE